MFTLEDGREQLYQWDLDRRIIVTDVNICEVHFCNRTSDCSLVVEVYTENNTMYANIPNILLQDARPIRAYAYCDDKYTLTEQQFSVKSRTKPSDYVYEETTVIRIDVLLDRAEEAVNLAEQSAEHADKTAKDLYDYVDTHTLEVTHDGQGNVVLEAIVPEGGEINLSNYYTKLETEALIDEAVADIAAPDLTGYAKLEDIPTIPENVSSFNNDAGYLTEHQSLEGYAKLTDIPTNYLTEVPSEYITETELNNKGYLTQHQSLEGYAKTTDIPDVSKFITEVPAEYVTDTELNAKGYLTEHQDLSTYATKTYVNNAVASVEPDLTSYATKTYVSNTVQAAIDDIPAPDLDNYYTKAQTDSAIGEAISGIEIPETDISGKADLVHQHSMADITDYVAPVIPSLDGYATEQYVDDAIANIPSGGGGEGGSGVKIIRIPNSTSYYQNNPDVVAELWQYLNDYKNNSTTPPDNVLFQIQSASMPSRWVTASTVNGNVSQYGNYLILSGFESIEEKYCHMYNIYFNSDGSFQRMQSSYSFVVDPSAGGGSDWKFTNSYSDLYNAKEIYLCYYSSVDGIGDSYLYSHVVLNNDVLSNRLYKYFPITSPNGYDNNVSFWYYDGSSINVQNSYPGYIEWVAYKE